MPQQRPSKSAKPNLKEYDIICQIPDEDDRDWIDHITFREGTIRYYEQGAGEPIVFIQGLLVLGLTGVIAIGVMTFGSTGPLSANCGPVEKAPYTNEAIELTLPDGATIAVEIQPAPELPQTEPDVCGIYLSRSNSTLQVGTGMFRINPGQSTVTFDGPKLDVVVTGETDIYHDLTELPAPGADIPVDGSGTAHLQQVVEPASLEDIKEYNGVTVWGTKRGDRIIATLLVYRTLGNGQELTLAENPTVSAFYLPMRDGVKIAVDVVLPADLAEGDQIPALMQMTRYWRGERNIPLDNDALRVIQAGRSTCKQGEPKHWL